MKKIFLIFTTVFFVFFSFLSPIVVYAADCDFDSSFLSFPYPDGDKLYLQFHCHDRNDTEGFLFYFEVSDISDVLSSDFSDGVLSISLNSNTTLYQHYIDYNNDHFSRKYSFSEFSYDSQSKKFTCITHGANILYLSTDYVVTDIDTNILDIHPKDIYVSVYPDLDYNFDYQVDFMGDSVPINLLQVDIYNNTNSSYQYAILIQPKDAYLETESNSNSRNTTVFWGDSPVTYALFKDEWIYVPGSYEAGHQLVNTPSAWHYLPATKMKREHIYFDQMMLKAGEEYTFKVIVYDLRYEYSLEYPIDYPRAVAPPISANKDTYSPSAQIVYSVDFSVKSDTNFDPNSNANGAYSFDPNSSLDSQFDKVKAIYNRNGQVEITEGADFSRVYQGSSSGSNSRSYIGSNVKTYNYLISNSSAFLGLCNGVFGYLPPFVRDLIYCGLFCIVLVFILKLFKG